MADQVTLPLVGPTNKRTLLIGGGAAAVLVGVLYLRKKQTPVTPAASSTDTTGTATDTTGADGSGQFFTGGGAGVGGFSVGGATGGFTDNAGWFADATQKLGGTVDLAALTVALGLYLTGRPVSSDQELLIDQAIAASGYPPVHGPNDYPPGIRQQAAGGGGGAAPTSPAGPGGGGDWTTHTTVHEGELLSNVLAFGGGMSQSDFEAHNSGIQIYYRWYQTGKGYAPGNTKRPGDVIALNTGHDITVTVKSGGW